MSRVVHIDDEVNVMNAEASAAFGRLRGSIWDRSRIRLDTKLKVYRSVVLPTLLYACQICTVYLSHSKRLDRFHTSYIRKFVKIKWQDRISDTEVLKRQDCRVCILFWNWHSYDGMAMLPVCLMNVYQVKSSMENYKWENAPMVVRRSDTRTPSKPPLNVSTYQQSRENRSHRIEQSSETS